MHSATLRAALYTVTLAVRSLAAQDLTPARTVDGTTVTSRSDPSVRIQLPPTFTYVGAHRWLLFDVADCEIHVFVEADAQKRVTRFYYIQFEAYLPSKPNYSYDYASRNPQQVTKDGMTFYVRPNFGPSNEPAKPGSEWEHVSRMISAAGYVMPPHLINVRLVSVLDDARRKELLIYYDEDMAPTGFTSETLVMDRAGRTIAPEWNAIAAALTQRALDRITILRQ
jgi:hypothetical protein